MPRNAKIDWNCHDCIQDTRAEYYVVRHLLWQRHGCGAGVLCIGCLELRMGRELARPDFVDCWVNTHLEGHPDAPTRRSDRLNSRLFGLGKLYSLERELMDRQVLAIQSRASCRRGRVAAQWRHGQARQRYSSEEVVRRP